MMRNALIVIAAVFVYDFGVLPHVDDFAGLCLVLLPPGLVIGVLISRPATFGTGMVMGAFGATQLALNNGYRADFATFANSSVALIVGLSSALVITRIIRSVGAAWSAERLLRANWQDVAAAANGRQDRAALTGLMIDRLGLMMPRLAAVASGADAAAQMALKDLRVGLNMIGLHKIHAQLPPVARHASEAVLAGVAAHYQGDASQPPPGKLCDAIDATIRAIQDNPLEHKLALMSLSGLRTVLFPAYLPPEYLAGAA